MDGFFFLVFRGMAGSVARFARNNALRQAGIFDELIAVKEETLQEIERSISENQAATDEARSFAPSDPVMPVSAENSAGHIIAAAMYRDEGFVGEYRQIRDNFIFDGEALVREAAAKLPSEETDAVKAAREIIDSLGHDACYQLATLSAEEQIDIFSHTLVGPQKALLDEYVALGNYFESYEFLSWLERYVFENSSRIVIGTGRSGESFDGIDERVTTQYDPSLCEGISILSKGRLYDYSIRNREIVG
jgi:hypothetical protein